MEFQPASPPYEHRLTLLDWLRIAGLPGLMILGLALLLFALFVILLVKRRRIGAIHAYLAASLFPALIGLAAFLADLMRLRDLQSDLANMDWMIESLKEMAVAPLMGCVVSMLGLLATVILGLLGPAKEVPQERTADGR